MWYSLSVDCRDNCSFFFSYNIHSHTRYTDIYTVTTTMTCYGPSYAYNNIIIKSIEFSCNMCPVDFRRNIVKPIIIVYRYVSDIVRSLHDVSIHFVPPTVERGQNVMLYCNYDLDGAPMLSVKWYRGSHEFYRYSPGMVPATQTFLFPGLNVDVSTPHTRVTRAKLIWVQLCRRF